jgi:hypothetical protein
MYTGTREPRNLGTLVPRYACASERVLCQLWSRLPILAVPVALVCIQNRPSRTRSMYHGTPRVHGYAYRGCSGTFLNQIWISMYQGTPVLKTCQSHRHVSIPGYPVLPNGLSDFLCIVQFCKPVPVVLTLFFRSCSINISITRMLVLLLLVLLINSTICGHGKSEAKIPMAPLLDTYYHRVGRRQKKRIPFVRTQNRMMELSRNFVVSTRPLPC